MMSMAQREQAMGALAHANTIRVANASLLRTIKSQSRANGLDFVAELLRHADLDGPMGSLPVGRLLRAIRGMGDERVTADCRAAQIFDPYRSLRRLSERQRHRLARALNDRAVYTRRRMRP